jgi:salicylate hydroxylase
LFRSSDGVSGQQRSVASWHVRVLFRLIFISNGRTGEIIDQSYHHEDTPAHRRSGRQRRFKLQRALLEEVDQSKIKLSKKLVSIEKLASGRVLIRFEAGYSDEVDLLIGADGIRSVNITLTSWRRFKN